MSTMYEPTGNVISPVLPADFTAVSAVDVPAGMSSPLAVPPTDNASTMARTTIIARRNLYPPPGGFSVWRVLVIVATPGLPQGGSGDREPP